MVQIIKIKIMSRFLLKQQKNLERKIIKKKEEKILIKKIRKKRRVDQIQGKNNQKKVEAEIEKKINTPAKIKSTHLVKIERRKRVDQGVMKKRKRAETIKERKKKLIYLKKEMQINQRLVLN